jgi:hypothetical protein
MVTAVKGKNDGAGEALFAVYTEGEKSVLRRPALGAKLFRYCPILRFPGRRSLGIFFQRSAMVKNAAALLFFVFIFPLSAQNLDITVEEFDGALTITKSKGRAKELVIPPSINDLPVTRIGPGAFSKRGLERLSLPDTITEIGDGAFADNLLASLVIGDNVTAIGSGAFAGNRLTEISLGAGLASIGKGVFSRNRINAVTISGNITSIGDYAFFSNNIRTLTIPGSVTAVGAGAFSGNKLSQVEIGAGVAGIGDGAFYNNQIKSVTIPPSVNAMGKRAFDPRTAGISGLVEYRDTEGKLLLSPSKNFDNFYSMNGKRAGTYTLTQEGWKYGE